jgi:hypothetical protein
MGEGRVIGGWPSWTGSASRHDDRRLQRCWYAESLRIFVNNRSGTEAKKGWKAANH